MSETATTRLPATAAAYVGGRPNYPVEIEGWLRRELGIGEGNIAVDLGSGTGKFLPRLWQLGPRSSQWSRSSRCARTL